MLKNAFGHLQSQKLMIYFGSEKACVELPDWIKVEKIDANQFFIMNLICNHDFDVKSKKINRQTAPG